MFALYGWRLFLELKVLSLGLALIIFGSNTLLFMKHRAEVSRLCEFALLYKYKVLLLASVADPDSIGLLYPDSESGSESRDKKEKNINF